MEIPIDPKDYFLLAVFKAGNGRNAILTYGLRGSIRDDTYQIYISKI